MLTSRVRRLVATAALWLAAAAPALADEGFWPFHAIPTAAIRQAHRVDLSDEWLRRLQLASVKIGGASGVFVSPEGLILTNHHVALWYLQRLSTADRDLVGDGFLARHRRQELPVPDLEVFVLQSIEDVTARVNGAVEPGMSTADAYAARRAEMTIIEEDSTDDTGLKSDVVTLYQGALFHLYRYKRYDDVRLVFAPEFDVAFFGGDPDNFTYPRFALDVAVFRAYEDGEPARPQAFLPVNAKGAAPGDVVFTAGHPGYTQRLNTVAHLEYLRDTGLPFVLRLLEGRHGVLARHAAGGAEAARQVKDEVFGVENALKSYRGQLAGLRGSALIAKKAEAEAALRAAVAKDPAKQREFGDAWKAVARARSWLTSRLPEHYLIESGYAFPSTLFSSARTIVRLVEESGKPDEERLPEYTDARLPSVEKKLFAAAPVYPAVEEAKLAAGLALARELLGADDPALQLVLGGRSPAERAAQLVRETRLADPAVRRALVDGGPEAVTASTDPMIRVARDLEPIARRLRHEFEREVASVERDAYARIARAGFAVRGHEAYPDATGTLRLSYGTIRGYREGGSAIAPFTTIGGLYARADEKGRETPWRLPARWIERRRALAADTPLNFVSTNDIAGGNSGSPVVNARGEVVGLIFDGNIHSLPAVFVYDDTLNRAVSVDVRAILEAMRDVYDAGALADELDGRAVARPVTAAER